MTRRERVIAAIKHQRTDFVPYHVHFTLEERQKIEDFLQDPQFESKINNHIMWCDYGEFKEIPNRKGYFQDLYGVIWNRTVDRDIGVIENKIIDDPENYNYQFPKIDMDLLERGVNWILSEAEDKFIVYGIGFSLFERAWTLRGMEDLLCDMVINPEFVHKLMNDICNYNLQIIEIINQYPAIDGIYFGDDWGQQKGQIMGAGHWREFIKPYLKKMYAAAKSKGKFVMQHSCGDIEELFPDLIEIGLDVYNTFQPEIYDLEKFKKTFGDKLTVWGGVSTQHVLAHGNPDDVRRETKKLIEIIGKNGGLIAAPTHSVSKDVPAENIMAMLEIFQNQRS